MTSDDIPSNQEEKSSTNSMKKGTDVSSSSNTPHDSPDLSSSDDNIVIEEIDELTKNDLSTDTLEFESISRRPIRRIGGRIRIILLLLIIGCGSYGAWTQWGDKLFGLHTGGLPIVLAPEEPIKVRPIKPGGINIPDRDKLVYDRLERKPPEERTEKLLPRPEVPLSPPKVKLVQTDELIAGRNGGAKIPKTIGSQPTPAEVKVVRKPELGKELSEPDISGSSKGVPVESRAEPKAASKIISSKSFGIVKESERAKTYQIQLAAVRSADSAKKEWVRLRTKNKRLLGKLTLDIVRADLGTQGIFFRLRAGPLANRARAKALCQALAKLKVGCLVIRPGK